MVLFNRFCLFAFGMVWLPTRTQILRKLDEVERLLPQLAAEFPNEREHLTMLRHLRNQLTYRSETKNCGGKS